MTASDVLNLLAVLAVLVGGLGALVPGALGANATS